MRAIDYAAQILVPTAAESIRNKLDRRLTYLTCLCAYHLIDYIAVERIHAAGANRARKAAHKAAKKEIQAAVEKRCPIPYKVVAGIANGLKHPERADRLPGAVVEIPGFAFDIDGAGFGQGRLDGPALAVSMDGQHEFLDTNVFAFCEALRALYPDHLTAAGIAARTAAAHVSDEL